MENDDGLEMRGEYAYAAMGGYEDSPEMRCASRHAVPKSQIGFAGAEGHKKFDQTTVQEWTKGMKNADGRSGAHWTMDPAKELMAQHNVSVIQPAELGTVLNSLYSDYCRMTKKIRGRPPPLLYGAHKCLDQRRGCRGG